MNGKIHFDMNYICSKNTPYKEQILPTGGYTSKNGNYTYSIMTRPNGKYIVIICVGKVDGWYIDYSKDCYGHFLNGFNFYSKSDFSVKMFFTQSVYECYEKIAQVYKKPFPYFLTSSNVIGGKIEILVKGIYKKLVAITPNNDVIYLDKPVLDLKQEGHYTIVADDALDCIVYAMPDIKSLHKKVVQLYKSLMLATLIVVRAEFGRGTYYHKCVKMD